MCVYPVHSNQFDILKKHGLATFYKSITCMETQSVGNMHVYGDF